MRRISILILGVAAGLVIAEVEKKSDYDHETKTYKSSFNPVSVSAKMIVCSWQMQI